MLYTIEAGEEHHRNCSKDALNVSLSRSVNKLMQRLQASLHGMIDTRGIGKFPAYI